MEYFQKSMRMQTRQKKCNVRKPYYLAFIYFSFVANIGAHSVFNIIGDIISIASTCIMRKNIPKIYDTKLQL